MTGFKEESLFAGVWDTPRESKSTSIGTLVGALVIEVVPGACRAQQGPAKLFPLSREAPVKIP